MPKFSFAANLVLALLLWSSSAFAADVMSTNLEERTVEGFNKYVQATETRIDHEVNRSGPFLHIESLPEPQSSELWPACAGATSTSSAYRRRELRAPPLKFQMD